jgi:hypothetical protein
LTPLSIHLLQPLLVRASGGLLVAKIISAEVSIHLSRKSFCAMALM